MKERPILFSAPMVRAILAGRKTQTRRLVKDCQQFRDWDVGPSDAYHVLNATDGTAAAAFLVAGDHGYTDWIGCPYGNPGNTLWVRETVRWTGGPRAEFVADSAPCVIDTWPWKRPVLPAIHMPRGASRLSLRVSEVRVQRLNEITEADCWAEGIEEVDGALDDAAIFAAAKAMDCSYEEARPTFAVLWDSINADRAPWASNPWVWAISFEVLS